jgi:hypothetical protein
MQKRMKVQFNIERSLMYRAEFWYKSMEVSKDKFMEHAIRTYINQLTINSPDLIVEQDDYMQAKIAKCTQIVCTEYPERII